MKQLADQLALTLRLLELERQRVHALTLQASRQMAQQDLLADELHRERRLREQADKESRAALAFKDATIHEVNHRTKNTLQMAASVLSLHANASASAPVREALQDSRQRLHVLANAHELLYAVPDSQQTISLSRLLETLGDALRQSFPKASAHVRLEVTSDAITLPADAAIPLALFANEAVTNAYKHAFPSDAPGTITVRLECTPENALALRIADTGIGMRMSDGAGGMGLKLIRLFAAQLQGVLEFAKQADEGGTVITLTIARPAQSGCVPDR